MAFRDGRIAQLAGHLREAVTSGTSYNPGTRNERSGLLQTMLGEEALVYASIALVVQRRDDLYLASVGDLLTDKQTVAILCCPVVAMEQAVSNGYDMTPRNAWRDNQVFSIHNAHHAFTHAGAGCVISVPIPWVEGLARETALYPRVAGILSMGWRGEGDFLNRFLPLMQALAREVAPGFPAAYETLLHDVCNHFLPFLGKQTPPSAALPPEGSVSNREPEYDDDHGSSSSATASCLQINNVPRTQTRKAAPLAMGRTGSSLATSAGVVLPSTEPMPAGSSGGRSAGDLLPSAVPRQVLPQVPSTGVSLPEADTTAAVSLTHMAQNPASPDGFSSGSVGSGEGQFGEKSGGSHPTDGGKLRGSSLTHGGKPAGCDVPHEGKLGQKQAVHSVAVRPEQDPLWLVFRDPALESRFKNSQAVAGCKVDFLMALCSLLVFAATLRGSVFQSGAPMWIAAAAYAVLVVTFAMCPQWYVCHREALTIASSLYGHMWCSWMQVLYIASPLSTPEMRMKAAKQHLLVMPWGHMLGVLGHKVRFVTGATLRAPIMISADFFISQCIMGTGLGYSTLRSFLCCVVPLMAMYCTILPWIYKWEKQDRANFNPPESRGVVLPPTRSL